jgi:CubicO group peptidase (beta-lactamase class C family)
MGKMFTAVGIMQLVQAGKLDLDAPIGTYLKDYPNAEFAHSVTARQLLLHTGGAGDFMSQKWADNIARLQTLADYVAMFGGRPPEFPPGSRFSYANYGYVVLGRIIEVASGQSYEAYLREHVFGPAGMTQTGLGSSADEAGVAMGYVLGPQGYRQSPAPFRTGATSAGGAYSTVGDMLAFASALTRHELLDATHTDLLTTGRVKGDDAFFAYGFEDRSAGGRRDVGHDGGAPGANGGFHILGDGEAVAIVFSNVAPTWRADKLANFIAARLR